MNTLHGMNFNPDEQNLCLHIQKEKKKPLKRIKVSGCFEKNGLKIC